MDYEAFFEWLASVEPGQARVVVTADLVLAIERSWRVGPDWHFRFVSGNPDEVPLLYREDTGEIIEGETTAGTWPATTTRVAIRPSARVLVVEVRRAGVGAANLERYFSRLGSEGFAPRVSVDLPALPAASFEAELDSFTRIREASLVVTRPNSDWDDANDILSELADASSGRRASVTVNAERGESLSEGRGIVGLIREHLRRPLSNVANARVTGSVPGTKDEKTVSLERHQLKSRVQVPRAASVSAEDESVFEAERRLLDESEQQVGSRSAEKALDRQ